MEDGDSMSKPSLEEYIYKLAPDTSVLDLVECYLTQHNTDTYYIGDKLVGFISDAEDVNFTFERALIRITLSSDITSGNLEMTGVFEPLLLNYREYNVDSTSYHEYDYAVIKNDTQKIGDTYIGNIWIDPESFSIRNVLVVMF